MSQISEPRSPTRPEPLLDELGGRLVVARRPGDRFGSLGRLVVYVDNSKVAKLRRGEECALKAEAGDHRIQVRMSGFASFPVWVRIANDHPTRVSFGIEDPRRDLKNGMVGWRAIKSRTRGGWGASVEPSEDRVEPS